MKKIRLKEGIKNLYPAYFALIMATAIVSVNALRLGYLVISDSLFVLAGLEYLVLLFLLGYRFFSFYPVVKSDLKSHTRSPGFFTVSAATAVMGIRFFLQPEWLAPAKIFWFISLLFWFIMMYLFFVLISIKYEKPDLGKGIDGTWLLIIVATQDISILGSFLSVYFSNSAIVLFFTLSLFLLASGIYIFMITLIIYRFTFFHVRPEDITFPYWVNAGSAATSALAGTILIYSMNLTGKYLELIPFLKAFSLMYWVIGTWWVPIVLLLEFWKFVIRKYPLSYNAREWSMIYSFGTYSLSTFHIINVFDISLLQPLAYFFFYLSFLIWIFTFIVMGKNLVRTYL